MRVSAPNINGRLSTPFFITVTSLLLAVASGLFVAGVGNAVWWFLGTLVALLFIGLLLTKHQVGVIGAGSSARGSLRRNWRSTMLLLGICCMVSLAWLGLRRDPLPVLDLGTSALVTVLFSLMSTGLVWYILRLPLLSFPILFLGVTFLYTSSSLILYQVEGLDAFRYWSLVHLESVMRAMPLVMLAFSSFLVGALLSAKGNPKRYPEKGGNISHPSSNTLRKIGLILYFVSLIVVVVLSFRGTALGLAFESGYHGFSDAKRSGQIPTLAIASLSWLLPWSVLILTATSQNRRSYVHTLLLAIPACGAMLMAGDRAALLPVILLMASGSYFLGVSMDWKRALVVVVLVALLLSTVVNLRRTPMREWSVDVVAKAVTNQGEGTYTGGSPISVMLSDMSSSYQTLMGTIMLVPDHEPHRYGFDYLRSLAVAIPFSSRLFPALGIDLRRADQPTQWITARLRPYGRAGLGFLQVAEAYLQFGVFGVIGLYLILGALLTRLWWHMRSEDLDSRKLALVLIVMTVVLNWIRNDSTGLMRSLSWGWILVYGLPAVLGELRRLGMRTEGQQRLGARHRL